MTNRESLPVLAAIEAMERPPLPCVCPIPRVSCPGCDHRCPACASAEPYMRPRPIVAALLRDIAAGIRVLNTMHGLCIAEVLIEERAANLVTALIGNYRIEEEP